MKNFQLLIGMCLLGCLLVTVGNVSAQQCQSKADCGQGEECVAKYLLTNPNDQYPPIMARYNFVRVYYTFLRFLADCYFAVVNAVFGLYNAFQPIQSVGQWQNASQLLFIPAHEAADQIRNLKLSSKALVSAYIKRIKAVNPLINGMVYTNFDNAMQQAADADAQLAKMSAYERANLALTKPLFGVPFTSKNNLQNTGFVITACNQALAAANATSTTDAPVVARVKAAGAILLGITGMPNMGLSTYCDDSACGVMNNPHDTRRTTGGSSAGESAMITSAGSLIGLGNDIGGSLRTPAHYNGIFGLKPTSYPNHTVPVEGVVPNFAAYPPAAEMLTNGPLCRYASDLPLLLSIMAGKSPTAYDKPVNFAKNFRLFYLEELDMLLSESLDPELRDSVRKVKSYFEEKYNLVVPEINFKLMNRELELWALTGFSEGVQPIFPNLTNQFFALLNSTGGQLTTTWALWEHEFMRNYVSPKDDAETTFVAAKKDKLRRQLGTLLGKDGVLVMPIQPAPVPYHHTEPFKAFNLGYAMLINVLGLPSMAVPTGKSPVTNMPLGVQLIGAPYNEALLIAVGRELEKAFGGWVAPGGYKHK